MSQFKYLGFISYSHADRGWGDWLHKALETWPVPERLVGRQTDAGTIPKRLAPIFRDRDELPSATDLGSKVNAALAQSANLIVICSPRSAASFWVNEEVLGFKRLGRADRVFCLIVDGEPNASNIPGHEAEECFAPALRYQLNADGELGSTRTEPIAADARPGKDGKANAKLKLISGLLDVGFDELRQREQQRAHRRLAWVASLAVAGMLLMTGLAALALQARNQAVFQREQAENLVGFMLGNLRTKLEAVSRLDILDEVADHAMGYFEAQGSDQGSIASRAKRADALLLIGRVRLEQGRLDDAEKAFVESLRISTPLAVRQSANPALRIAVADGHMWIGKTQWQRGDLDQAMTRFRTALPIVTAIAQAHPDVEDWQTRLGWAHNNLGHILEARGALPQALREYTEVLGIDQRLADRHPGEDKFKQQVADAHDSIGKLLYSRGDLAGAERHYLSERALYRQLVASDPRNAVSKVNLAIAETFLAHVSEALGHGAEARSSLQEAHTIGEAMLADDPGNIDKIGDVASYCRRLARNLRLAGNATAASLLVARARDLYAQMLVRSPDGVRGKFGLAATSLEQARVAWQLGNIPQARVDALAGREAFAALVQKRDDDRDARLGLAGAQLLLGKLDAAQGDTRQARRSWSEALDAMRIFGADSLDPDQLSVQAEALQRLGRNVEAQGLVSRLEAMRYRDPEFIAWTEANGMSRTSIPGPPGTPQPHRSGDQPAAPRQQETTP